MFFLMLALLAGIFSGMQGPINGGLGSKIGALEAALFNFLTGTFLLAVIVISGGKGNLLLVREAPWWQLTGGLLGAGYVFLMLFTIPRLGAAMALLALITGQMAMGMIADSLGLFGLEQIPVNFYRLAGLILLICSLLLIYKGTGKS
ncbi:transporter family-2 protein [Desulfofundulus luciae]|uniref:Transporter family-2 protein n=1 Tax=Desulfofundulus luciae TaxID=74702 RepID=A0ABU0B1Q2_9FIRM|nr:DMT family transporter [Desulfofundulus luciae]MDQ0285383.1 transporter family-2 protein [Desulfofundulus luciae]